MTASDHLVAKQAATLVAFPDVARARRRRASAARASGRRSARRSSGRRSSIASSRSASRRNASTPGARRRRRRRSAARAARQPRRRALSVGTRPEGHGLQVSDPHPDASTIQFGPGNSVQKRCRTCGMDRAVRGVAPLLMSIQLPRNQKELHFTGSVKALERPATALGRERPKGRGTGSPMPIRTPRPDVYVAEAQPTPLPRRASERASRGRAAAEAHDRARISSRRWTTTSSPRRSIATSSTRRSSPSLAERTRPLRRSTCRCRTSAPRQRRGRITLRRRSSVPSDPLPAACRSACG